MFVLIYQTNGGPVKLGPMLYDKALPVLIRLTDQGYTVELMAASRFA